MASRCCPKCGAEYREGFSECADCGVVLVDDPPTAPPAQPDTRDDRQGPFSPDDDTVELLRTNAIEAEVIAARLRSEGIPAVVFGGSAYGGGPAVGEGSGVRVMVRRADLEIATALASDESAPEPE